MRTHIYSSASKESVTWFQSRTLTVGSGVVGGSRGLEEASWIQNTSVYSSESKSPKAPTWYVRAWIGERVGKMREGERQRGRKGERAKEGERKSQRDKNRDIQIQIESVCVCTEGIYSESESE
jgi:hypothetical protein